jgi:hypothetical protein|nr:MAG TPA: Protein of unknown function (DUF806) [Caudoviricetes sp.]
MIDYHSNLVSALKTIGIPVHFEMTLHSGLETPCISYMELSNVAAEEGDTLGYSRLQYQIKVWGTQIADLQKYALQIDKKLRTLGFKRVGCNEMYDNNSAMIQKIMTYECLAHEDF